MTDCAQERYRLMQQIGQGGMGTVYLAYDRKLGVERVIKEVRVTETSNSEKKRQQFVSEINIIKEIQHPFIPQVVDLVSEGDAMMIVMEKIEGETLYAHIHEQGCVTEKKAIDWGIQLAQILLYLHGKDPPVFHKDLKPENVILHPSGRLYLIDFGIAGHPMDYHGGDEFKGTFGYAAPEQYLTSAPPDGRADIFSLGRLLLFCLFGNPSGTDGPGKTGEGRYRISDSFRDFLNKCTESDPGKRYQSVDKLMADIIRLEKKESHRRTRREMISARIFKRPGFPGTKLIRYYAWIFAGILLLVLAGKCAGRIIREREAEYLLDRALETPDMEKKRIYFQESLKKAPWKESVYKNMLETYVVPNHFSTREAVQMMDIIQNADALPVFKKQNREAYARFCYDLGIGYFYQMGGGTGKMESGIWFHRAENAGAGLTHKQCKRASCYQKIGEYYRSFLYYGQDRNKEGSSDDYGDFFKTLRQLASYSLEYSEESDQSSAWYAACEVVTEIRDYAGYFLREKEITGDVLRKELEKIEIFMSRWSGDIDGKKKNQLEDIIAEAKKRIEIMEANYEMQNTIRVLGDSSDHHPDTGTAIEGRDRF